MGHTILKQKDERYCIFSSICDDLIQIDLTKKELKEYYLERARTEIDERIDRYCKEADIMTKKEKLDEIDMVKYNKRTKKDGLERYKKLKELF